MFSWANISLELVIVVLLALGYDFITGFHDTANSIATSVSTRVLSPRLAILMAATLNFAGAMFSSAVAKTISSGIVQSSITLPQYVIIGALLAAIIWGLITWKFGIPSSSSHALIGGLVGSAIVYSMSFGSIKWSGVLDKVVIPLVTSPILGFILGFIIMSVLFKLLAKVALRIINRWFAKLQIVSAALMAFAHGSNDAQKSMGIITLALISAHVLGVGSDVPWDVKLACAVMMGLGTSVGGWRIIKTMGVNMIKLQPIGGFAAETTAATIILNAASLGMQVSTTHVISASIMGVGAAKRLSAVRWTLVRSILIAWVITLPVTAVIGAGFTYLLGMVVPH